MKKLIAIFLLAPLCAIAAEAGYRLDQSPHDPTDLVSLQVGARTYVNYCLGCHSLQYMRYSGLRELGLSEAQIRDNLMFTADKVGEPMKTTLGAKEGKLSFGVAPPDLSVISRVRGADWLYTYLRAFYRDEKTASSWNNAVFQNVAMPHPLWELQGPRTAMIESIVREKKSYSKTTVVIDQNGKRTEEKIDLPAGHSYHTGSQITLASPPNSERNAAPYDATVRDLVNFLVYVGDPKAASRKAIGIIVLFVLGVLFVFTYLLKKEYWKDVK